MGEKQITIRKACLEDMKEIKELFVYARRQMKINGNPTQWGDNRPAEELFIRDIDRGEGYIVLKGQVIVGYFAFIIGEDPTYLKIEGEWLNDLEYGTIHRIAKNNNAAGIMGCILNFCKEIMNNIRIDTHRDNKIMQHILEKSGFIYCGIIYVDDGTPRMAYQSYENK